MLNSRSAKHIYLYFLGLLFIFFIGKKNLELQAAELPYFYTATSAFGMGGAHTAISNDGFSPWTNPAGISRIRKNRSRKTLNLIRMPEITAATNQKGQQFVSAIRGNGDEAEKIANITSAVAGDQNSFAGSAAYSSIATGVLGFMDIPRHSPWVLGAMTHSHSKIISDSPSTTNPGATVEFVSDTFGILGMAFTNRTNRVNAGIQIRQISRFGYEDKMEIATLAAGDFNALKDTFLKDSNQLSATAVDFGFMATLADFWFPTIGLAAYNLPVSGCVENYLNPYTQTRQTVCGTVYSGTIQNPESLHLVDPTDLRAGISITPRLSRKFAFRFAVDMHHIVVTPDNKSYYGLDGIGFQKQLHGGVEIVIGNPITINPVSFRFGMNQGITTYGASLRLGWLSLEFASYGVDTSASVASVEDRRNQATIAIDLN